MTDLFHLRNKLSNRILTPTQQINTKGRGRDNMEKDNSFEVAPASPITPSTPSNPSVPTTQRGNRSIQRGNPSGPPQFGPGGFFAPII